MVVNAKRTFERTPLTAAEKAVVGDVDYGMGLTDIKNAVNQLNELVPDGNADLTEKGYARLLKGVRELGAFLKIRGCVIEVPMTDAQVDRLIVESKATLANEVFSLIEACTANGIEGEWLDNASAAVALAIRDAQPPVVEGEVQATVEEAVAE